MIFIIIIYIIQGVIFGFAVDSVITNKGYNDNWFWLGFFFGFFALIVALSKPEVTHVHYSESLLLQKAQRNISWTLADGNAASAILLMPSM